MSAFQEMRERIAKRGRAKKDERALVVEYIRDIAKRLSVQTGERAVGAADAAYLIASSVECGDHLLTDDEASPKRSTDNG